MHFVETKAFFFYFAKTCTDESHTITPGTHIKKVNELNEPLLDREGFREKNKISEYVTIAHHHNRTADGLIRKGNPLTHCHTNREHICLIQLVLTTI